MCLHQINLRNKGGNILCVYFMLEKYETSDRYTRGRKDVFVVGKELAVLEMYLLIPIKVS